MRRVVALLVLAALSVLAAGCGGSSKSSAKNTTAAAAGSCSNPPVVKAGQLTIGTDNPAYTPWFGGGELKGSKWKSNDPSTGKGFESAVAYAVAKQLGFPKDKVHWAYVPFNTAFAPGAKSFDFDINQISYTPARARVVDFSSSYYDVNQAIVVKTSSRFAGAKSIADLKRAKLGAQLGTTSYQYIKDRIKPSQQPGVFPKNDAAVQALKNGQIDGLVVDLPTAFFVTAVEVPGSKILGQFPAPAGGEHFGLVLQKGSPLTRCVDKALAALESSGQLKRIQQQWLAKSAGAPVLS